MASSGRITPHDRGARIGTKGFICGFCSTAWDILYGVLREGDTPAGRWVEYCKFGGCDEDVWDYIDEKTLLWTGEIPKNDSRYFHRCERGVPVRWDFRSKKFVAKGREQVRVLTQGALLEMEIEEAKIRKAAAKEIDWAADDELDDLAGVDWE